MHLQLGGYRAGCGLRRTVSSRPPDALPVTVRRGAGAPLPRSVTLRHKSGAPATATNAKAVRGWAMPPNGHSVPVRRFGPKIQWHVNRHDQQCENDTNATSPRGPQQDQCQRIEDRQGRPDDVGGCAEVRPRMPPVNDEINPMNQRPVQQSSTEHDHDPSHRRPS